MAAIILEAADIEKSFIQPDKNKLVILQNLCLRVEQGSVVAITGASGSGKSTLLHLLGSLDRPDSGPVRFAGEDIAAFSRKRLAAYRNRDIGFVFQFHYLMPELTVLENVAAPGVDPVISSGSRPLPPPAACCAKSAWVTSSRSCPTSCRAAKNSGRPSPAA